MSQWAVVPNFAKQLPELYEAHERYILADHAMRKTTEESFVGSLAFDSFRLIEAMHSNGINVRYLGVVFTFLIQKKTGGMTAHSNCLALLLVEMILRVLKHDLLRRLRQCMQELKEPLDEVWLQVARHQSRYWLTRAIGSCAVAVSPLGGALSQLDLWNFARVRDLLAHQGEQGHYHQVLGCTLLCWFVIQAIHCVCLFSP
jgi:hypothetical protein